MPANFIKRIPLLPPAPAGTTQDCIVMDVGLSELRDWQDDIHKPFITNDGNRRDSTWNWPMYYLWSNLLNESRGRVTDAFQLVVDSPDTSRDYVPVGQAILVHGYPHPDEESRTSTFVWFLTSTPAGALAALGIAHRYMMLPLLLDTAIQKSIVSGFDGRIALHADDSGSAAQKDDLLRRYARCGLTQLPHLKGRPLSTTRTMDERYFVHTPTSALVETGKWDHLR